MLDTDRAAHLTDKLLEVIVPELNRQPRTPDNVWCVIDAVACVVAGLIKEPVARRYYGRALDHYSPRFGRPGWVNFSARCKKLGGLPACAILLAAMPLRALFPRSTSCGNPA